jgi:hypothetical protein
MTADTLADTAASPSHAPTYPAHWRMVRLGDAFRFTKKPRELQLDRYAVIPFIPNGDMQLSLSFLWSTFPSSRRSSAPTR